MKKYIKRSDIFGASFTLGCRSEYWDALFRIPLRLPKVSWQFAIIINEIEKKANHFLIRFLLFSTDGFLEDSNSLQCSNPNFNSCYRVCRAEVHNVTRPTKIKESGNLLTAGNASEYIRSTETVLRDLTTKSIHMC